MCNSEIMKLTVTALSNDFQPVTIDVSCDATVDHFRTLVAEALKVPAYQVRLMVFAGQPLEKGQPLSAYNLFDSASLIAIINKQFRIKEQLAFSSQHTSISESTDQCGLDSSGNFCTQSAKRAKLDILADISLVTLLRELAGRAFEISSDHIHLSYDGQMINDDTAFAKQFPQTLMQEICHTDSRSSDTSTKASEKIRVSSSSHILVIRITRELKSSEENRFKSFDVVCEVEKDNNSLTANILQVINVGNISLSSIPSSKPNEDHFIDIDHLDLSGISPAQWTRVFFYDGSAKFIRDLIAKECSVNRYLVFLEMKDNPVHDDEFLTFYCIHNTQNISQNQHWLQHRIFRSPIEEIAWRMNNDVCSKREFLSYISGLPEIQPLTADPNNIRKMLLTHPLLKRIYKQFSEIIRILHWDDYLLYRMKMFKNPECLPSIDHVSLDPAGWNQLMIDWPIVQQLYVQYPEIRPILMWEEYLSYRTSLVTNPSFLSLYREVVRNQDRELAQYERYSDYSSFMLNVALDDTESSDKENHPDPPASELSHQNPNYSILGEPGEEVKSSDEDLKTYIANISRFANKLLKHCPQFNDAIICNPFMQSFVKSLANDSRLIDGIIEETTPEVKKDPSMLSWARKEISKIMMQMCDPEGREKFSNPSATKDDFLDPASQVMNALDVLRKAGYPVSEILGPSDKLL